jgi:hypothetical protein
VLCSKCNICRESSESSPFIHVLAVYCCMRFNVVPDIEPRLGMTEELHFDSLQRQEVFSFLKHPDRLQRPNDLHWGKLSPEVKRPGCESNHSSPSVAIVKHAWSCTSDL